MNIEVVLREQIAELEKLIQLKDKRIVELEKLPKPINFDMVGSTYSTDCIHKFESIDNGPKRCAHCRILETLYHIMTQHRPGFVP